MRASLIAATCLSFGLSLQLAAQQPPAAPSPRANVQQVIASVPPQVRLEIAARSGIVDLGTAGAVGLEIGPVYRARVSWSSADGELITFFPTIQLLGFLSPPQGIDPSQFAVPLPIGRADFTDVGDGNFIQNVVYLEDPLLAVPIGFPRGEFPVTSLASGQNPLARASELGRPLALIQVGTRTPQHGELVSGAHDPEVFFASSAEPSSGPCRVCGQTACRAHPVAPTALKRHPRMPWDEYVCDGGDDGYPVHFSGYGFLEGVEPGQAAVQYRRASETRPRAETANKACVYSPRFGLIRSYLAVGRTIATQPVWDLSRSANRAVATSRQSAAQRSQRLGPERIKREEAPANIRVRNLAAGLEELRVIMVANHRERISKTRGAVGSVKLIGAEELRLASTIQPAIYQKSVTIPAYTALTASGAEVGSHTSAFEIREIQRRRLTPGRLQLRKLVDQRFAHSGDVLEFHIQYRNVGGETVESVSIIDNLVGRLEYIAGSAKSDRRAVFTSEANIAGSLELRWDVLEPIEGGKGGEVWFQAKVR